MVVSLAAACVRPSAAVTPINTTRQAVISATPAALRDTATKIGAVLWLKTCSSLSSLLLPSPATPSASFLPPACLKRSTQRQDTVRLRVFHLLLPSPRPSPSFAHPIPEPDAGRPQSTSFSPAPCFMAAIMAPIEFIVPKPSLRHAAYIVMLMSSSATHPLNTISRAQVYIVARVCAHQRLVPHCLS